MMGRFPVSAKLYQLPQKPTKKCRGAPREKGNVIGPPKILAQTSRAGRLTPAKRVPRSKAAVGLWHAGLPGGLMRVVVVRRDAKRCTKRAGQRKPSPPFEAFIT